MNLALGERGNFMVDEPADIPSEPEAGVPATLEEEIVKIPVVISLDIPDKPEGATAVMEEQKEATSVSDRSEEVSAPVIKEVEEKVAIEGAICVTGMNPSGNSTAIVMEAVKELQFQRNLEGLPRKQLKLCHRASMKLMQVL
jgi:hypothetical protein